MSAFTTLERVSDWAATGLTTWLVLLAISGPSAALQQPPVEPRPAGALDALGYLAADDDEEQALGPGIHIVVSSAGSVDVTHVQAIEVAGVPDATLATGTRLALDDEKFAEKLAGVLKVMVEPLEKQPLVEGDPTGPQAPSVQLRIQVDETRAFRTVQRIMEVCARRELMIWNIELVVLPSSGEKRSFETPLPGRGGSSDAPAAGNRVREGSVEISIEVKDTGRRVDVATGEAWSGEGPFRFEDRVLTYVVTADGRGGGDPPVEEELESSDPRPESGLTISIQTQEQKSLAVALDLAKRSYPNARVVIAAKTGTVYGDVVGVLDLVVTRFSSISFVGAR